MQDTGKSGSFFHRKIQTFVGNYFYPRGNGDWYVKQGYGTEDRNPFNDFLYKKQQDPDSEYYEHFKTLTLKCRMLPSKLANGDDCQIEVFDCKPNLKAAPKAGTGKHIVFFTGLNGYYQDYFVDIATACKETGATMHAFNFPGASLSTGQVNEANDIVNAGISLVHSLLKKGIHPDDIILQGSSFGASVALEVKLQYKEQCGIKLRTIMNNTFDSFKAAISDHFNRQYWLPHFFSGVIKSILQYTGWHMTPAKKYRHADPYQCHIQHLHDQTIPTTNLSNKVAKYKAEIDTGETRSTKREPVTDNCPEEYKAARDHLDQIHMVQIRESAREYLAKKYGSEPSEVNSHYGDLCDLETINGNSVYEEFINYFLTQSDAYIEKNPQKAFCPEATPYLLTGIEVLETPSVKL